MKKIYLLFFILFCFTNCDNDDDTPQNPADQLPEATQTGAGTFACLVDGKPFIGDNPYFNCYYQYVDGGWHFGIRGDDEVKNVITIRLGAYDYELSEGRTYTLARDIEENVFGEGRIKPTNSELSSTLSTTSSEYTGELTITKLDFENYIVSGTFWFDLKNPFTGDTIKIREGRFDTLFGM